MEPSGHAEGREEGDVRSVFETARLVHCWAAALDLLRPCALSEASWGLFVLFGLPAPALFLHFWEPPLGWASLPSGHIPTLGLIGDHPMCPFLEALPALLSCSGHSGSGKTEAAKKMVQFLHSLEREQTRERRCRVRGSSPLSRDPRGTFPLLWARRVVFRPLASPRVQPQALSTAGAGETDPSMGRQSPHVVSSPEMPH